MPTIEITLSDNQAVRFDDGRIIITEKAIETMEPAFEFNLGDLVEKPGRKRRKGRPALALVT